MVMLLMDEQAEYERARNPGDSGTDLKLRMETPPPLETSCSVNLPSKQVIGEDEEDFNNLYKDLFGCT